MGEDDVLDPVYYNDITQDIEKAALIVGTVTMESPKQSELHLIIQLKQSWIFWKYL